LVEGKADWKPVDGKITIGEWLGYAAEAVPTDLTVRLDAPIRLGLIYEEVGDDI